MSSAPTWQVEVTFSEDEDHTRADAILQLGDQRFHGWGRAKRASGDPNVPVVGEELAAARALSDLTHKLLGAASARIEAWEGSHVAISS